MGEGGCTNNPLALSTGMYQGLLNAHIPFLTQSLILPVIRHPSSIAISQHPLNSQEAGITVCLCYQGMLVKVPNGVHIYISTYSAGMSKVLMGTSLSFGHNLPLTPNIWNRVNKSEPFFSRLQKVFSALGRKYYIMLTINVCILAIYFCTHEYLEQNPILLLNSLMMCLKICEKFFWIIMQKS